VRTRRPAVRASKAATQRLPKWTALTQYQAKGDHRSVMQFRTEGETWPVPTATIRRLRPNALLVRALTAAQVLTTSQVRRGPNPSLPAQHSATPLRDKSQTAGPQSAGELSLVRTLCPPFWRVPSPASKHPFKYRLTFTRPAARSRSGDSEVLTRGSDWT
jgi:hypothetical protein